MLACLGWSVAFPVPASAATYYVRSDGGTAAQCNGSADAPASASPNCAWASPMDALPPSGYAARIKGGDTLVIGPGQYPIGVSTYSMAAYSANCYQSYPWNCVMAGVPSGTAANPTRIVGAGFADGCKAPPQLYGVNGTYNVLDLGAASNVIVACLEITDHSACADPYGFDKAIACNNKTYPYGDWGETGIRAKGGTNVLLQDLNIHGLANTGLMVGGMKDLTLRRVTIRGNGYAGWIGDLGAGSSFSGTITLDHVRVLWNGCSEQYPATTIYACWGQNTGGYGDGVGMTGTGGNWVITHSAFNYNTQDGLDLLYADGTGTITIDHSQAIGNAGNGLKTAGNATYSYNVVVGNCDALAKFPGMAGSLCRSGGGAIAAEVGLPAQTVTFRYNTVTGNGDCLMQGGTEKNTPAAATQVYQYDNNIFLGQKSWLPRNDGGYTCLAWYTDTWPDPTTVKYSNNIIWNVRNFTCGPPNICRDPLLKNETLENFDPTPLPGSPAIGTATGRRGVGAAK